MSHPQASEVRAHPARQSEPYRRFDRYTMMSLYAVPPLAPFTSGLILANAATYSWLTVAHLAALVGAAVLCALVLRAAIDRALEGSPWPRTLVVAFIATCLLAAGFGAFAAPPTGDVGLDLPTSAVLISLLTCVFGFSPATTWRALPLLALAVAAPTTLSWMALHPGDVTAGRWFPALFGSFLMALGLVVSGALTTWMLRQMREQAELTVVRSELAVAEERLRFSRDLHDIFGRTLTAVAVKSDLAAELAQAGRVELATVEMREVQGVAHEALREVRAVVAGYRTVDLPAELKGARAMLLAAGIRARLLGAAEGIDTRAAEALAWVVREGATNVVHHSDATSCTISLTLDQGWATVNIINDGVRSAQPRPHGGGITGLRERLRQLGGTVETHTSAGTFALTGRVPQETE